MYLLFLQYPTVINTLIYATRTLLVLFNYLLFQDTLLKFIDYPVTTHLLPLPLYNPVTQ